MEQCPNCGHKVRFTAKFCTSCGFRLPERNAAGQPLHAGAMSPFATTATVKKPEPKPIPATPTSTSVDLSTLSSSAASSLTALKALEQYISASDAKLSSLRNNADKLRLAVESSQSQATTWKALNDAVKQASDLQAKGERVADIASPLESLAALTSSHRELLESAEAFLNCLPSEDENA